MEAFDWQAPPETNLIGVRGVISSPHFPTKTLNHFLSAVSVAFLRLPLTICSLFPPLHHALCQVNIRSDTAAASLLQLLPVILTLFPRRLASLHPGNFALSTFAHGTLRRYPWLTSAESIPV